MNCLNNINTNLSLKPSKSKRQSGGGVLSFAPLAQFQLTLTSLLNASPAIVHLTCQRTKRYSREGRFTTEALLAINLSENLPYSRILNIFSLNSATCLRGLNVPFGGGFFVNLNNKNKKPKGQSNEYSLQSALYRLYNYIKFKKISLSKSCDRTASSIKHKGCNRVWSKICPQVVKRDISTIGFSSFPCKHGLVLKPCHRDPLSNRSQAFARSKPIRKSRLYLFKFRRFWQEIKRLFTALDRRHAWG